MGVGGLEPPKSKDGRFTVCSRCRWRTLPKRASCRIRIKDPEITKHVLWSAELKSQSLYVNELRFRKSSANIQLFGFAPSFRQKNNILFFGILSVRIIGHNSNFSILARNLVLEIEK